MANDIKFVEQDVIAVRGAACPHLFGERSMPGPRCTEVTLMSKKQEKKKKKRTALVMCRNGNQFWTTQTQFWQWFRDGVIVKTQDHPLTGAFLREHEELMVKLSNTVLNLACPNHLREALESRRVGLPGR